MKVVSAKDLTKLLQSLGYSISLSKRSHIICTKGKEKISVPNHKEISVGVLRAIIRQLNISTESFNQKLSYLK